MCVQRGTPFEPSSSGQLGRGIASQGLGRGITPPGTFPQGLGRGASSPQGLGRGTPTPHSLELRPQLQRIHTKA